MTQDAEALSEAAGWQSMRKKLRTAAGTGAHANKYISIHVETEEYALGDSSGDALRTLRKHHPEGWLVTLKIGTEPEWGLAARLLVGQMMTGQQK